ncbi:MAG: ribbon-helix-helix protein, CopG family [Thermoplasmatota archaeon]
MPEKMNEEIQALIKSRYSDNKSELVRDALRFYF